MNSNEFSVCQFFEDGTYDYVRRGVSADEAVDAFKHYTTNVMASFLGLTKRVIITDGGDCIVAEWVEGKVTFPTQEQLK